MLMLSFKKVFRDLHINKSRTILVLTAMIIGIVGVGSVLDARSILKREMNKNYMKTNPASASILVENLNRSIVDDIRNMPEVKDAEEQKTVIGRVRTRDGSGKEIYLYVVKDFLNRRMNTFKADKGKWPAGKGEILIERAAMQVIDAKIGDRLEVKIPGLPEKKLLLAGTVHAPALPPAWMEGVSYGFISLETYKQLGGADTLGELKVLVAEKQMDKNHIQAVTYKVKKLLEDKGRKVVRIDIPKPGKHPHASQMETLLFLLEAFGIIALILSAVIVANMISAILSQQKRQIGIMKAVGAKGIQIVWLYMTFVLTLGIISVAAGIPIAILAARGYSIFAAGMLNFDIFSFSIPVWAYSVQIAVGILLPASAALYFIIGGSKVTVREALQDYGISLKKNNLGSNIDIKFFTRPFLLSLRNTFRKKGRLFFTLCVLAIGGSLFITAMNVSFSMNTSSEGVVKSFLFDASINLARPYDTIKLKKMAEKVSGIKSVEIWSGAEAAVVDNDGLSGNNFSILAIPPESKLLSSIKPNKGSWLSSEDDNSIVINQLILDYKPGLQIGDILKLRINGHIYEWKVKGIVPEIMSEPKAYVNQAYFQKIIGQRGFGSNVIIAAKDKSSSAKSTAVRNLEKALDSEGFETAETTMISDIREKVEAHLSLLAALLIFMSTLGVVVGGLGLSTTMSINIIERTREIGVMRAIGASTKTIFRIIISEGGIIGLLSWILAVVVATPVSYFISYMFGMIFFETPLKVSFSIKGIVIWLVLALLFAVFASLLPAGKASKISVRQALAYE